MQWANRIGRRIKLRDLHVFLAVSDEGSMAKAAERLAISRPVVSKAISDLEQILGVRLLDRTSNGVEPTLYGRTLLKRSLAAFDELKQSVREIEYLADPRAGEIRIGCTEVMSAGLVSVAVDRLIRRHPEWVFHLHHTSVPAHLEMLRSRTCDIVVGRTDFRDAPPDVEIARLYNEKLLIVVGLQSKWSRRRNLALSELVDEPWIQAPLEVAPGGPTFEAFSAAGLTLPRVSIYSDSLNLRYSLLETGRFITMIPESALRLGPARTTLKVLPIDIPRWTQSTAVSFLKHRTLGPIAQAVIEAVREAAGPLTQHAKI